MRVNYRILRNKIVFLKNCQRNQSRSLLCESENYTSKIGLEVHAQIWSNTKLFSEAPNRDDAPLNSVVSLFDIATPGTLPVLNKRCVLQCLKAALSFDCEIPLFCRFDRKHYFYPDMPSGYQITQHEYPIAKNGKFNYYLHAKNYSHEKSVRIKQLQLETDSGKSLFHGDLHLIDLNRAGVGLIEIVTAPELYSPEEATAFLDQLRLHLVHYQICKGEFFQGHIRADVNISLKKNGVDYPRVEIKNIGSTDHLRIAIEKEIMRQKRVLSDGGIIESETRSLVEEDHTTRATRTKGEDLDYRIIPEPNLPRLVVERSWIQEARCELESFGMLSHMKYIKHNNLDPHIAFKIAENKRLDSFFSRCLIDLKVSVDTLLNWMDELVLVCDKLNVKYPPEMEKFIPIFVELVNLEGSGRITKLICIDLIKFYMETTDFSISVEQKIENDVLWRISDKRELENFVDTVFKTLPNVVSRAITSDPKEKHFRKLRNEVINQSKKRISLTDIEEFLRVKLSQLHTK